MHGDADIVLSTKDRDPDLKERILYLYELESSGEDLIFEYKYSDWSRTSRSYFIFHNDEVYFNNDKPVLNIDNKVPNWYRPHAWSSDELRSIINDYLVNKILLE